ncbi:hypothetical protein ACFSL4_36960 [Streptomyces caeni]|uniref:Transposase n=1 Tax=Streptomyces caeni TaxID=2307231 RepID=A0ABW4J322_9ACTN
MAHGDVAGGVPSSQVTAVGGWICFEDEAGAWLNGPVRRTWGKAGYTPVLRMSGKRNDKISMVAWVCFKEGVEPRLIYAVKPSGGYTKKDFPRFFALLHRRVRLTSCTEPPAVPSAMSSATPNSSWHSWPEPALNSRCQRQARSQRSVVDGNVSGQPRHRVAVRRPRLCWARCSSGR